MADLIDRKAAIDAIDTGNLHRGIVEALQNIISELPPAQPEIKCIAKIMLTEEQVQEAFEKAKKEILAAQPEIIRCKDCKHFEYDHPYIIQGIPLLGHEVCNAWGDGCKTDENGYCFMAERRTDDN